jgi:fluoride exporter
VIALGIAIAGALGAPSRYLVDRMVQRRNRSEVPGGTLLINVTGSLVLGFLVGLVTYHAFPKTPELILGTGFCGAYTTFSTFTFETVRLIERRQATMALTYATASIVGSLAAAGVGLALAAAL